MSQFFVITFWEFFRHFKSRSFLLATFISPLIFAAIVLIPTLFLEDQSTLQPKIVGCVEFDTTGICRDIRERFMEASALSDQPPAIKIVPVQPDSSLKMLKIFNMVSQLKTELDSLEDAYNQIKERRKYIFQKPKTASRRILLKNTYADLIQIREARDLAQLEYQDAKNKSDSLWRVELQTNADRLLRKLNIEGYLLVDPVKFEQGIVEFHSLLPSNFLDMDPVKHAVQVVMVEHRLRNEGLQLDKIEEYLEPIILREIQLQGEQKQEFDFMVNYLGPIVVVLFLFISIFTSSGFLFNGVLNEKTDRVIELLLSSVSHLQLISGKILGLGILGLFQIIIWFGLTLILIGMNVLDVGEIGFFTITNAGLFLLYFVLGYLFFASIFVGIGSLFSNAEDAHHLNQFMRLLSIFPIVLAVLVLETPNSMLVRILSFVPPLTPTFMILRTPLGNPATEDYFISTGIMIVSIIISVFLAGKIFKVGSLLYGKKPSLKEIFGLFFVKG